jgi:diaminopimelate epimerase
MPTSIDFVKTQALGNDFILVEREGVAGRTDEQLAAMSRRICDRHFGVGADGLIFWQKVESHFALRIFNSDSSEAECSGNGLRCAAAYLIETGRWPHSEIQLKTISGVYTLRRAGAAYEADMGLPSLRPEQIPFIPLLARRGQGEVPDGPLDRVVNYPLWLDGSEVRISACSTGNPHCSLFVPEIDEKAVNDLGARLERHPAFPNRTNVEFIRVLNDQEIEVAFWERGAGPTFASGTGSCGATVASILNGKTGRSVTVHTKGGDLQVEWPEGGRLKLTSTASIVAEGRYLETI